MLSHSDVLVVRLVNTVVIECVWICLIFEVILVSYYVRTRKVLNILRDAPVEDHSDGDEFDGIAGTVECGRGGHRTL